MLLCVLWLMQRRMHISSMTAFDPSDIFVTGGFSVIPVQYPRHDVTNFAVSLRGSA